MKETQKGENMKEEREEEKRKYERGEGEAKLRNSREKKKPGRKRWHERKHE